MGEPGAVKALAKLVAGLVLALAAIAVVFVTGMRSKSPVVLDAVRRASRAMKPLMLKSAGRPGVPTSVIRHVGRRTGRAFDTPVEAAPTDDGFAIALPYGVNTDWLKNVIAAGSATIVHDGNTYEVDHPEVVPIVDTNHYFRESSQRAHRRFNVEESLRLRKAELVTR